MNATAHFEPEDLALFAMQLLPQNDATAIAEHLQHCGECRRTLADVQGDLAAYAHSVDLHTPSAEARERLLKQVSREPKTVAIDQAPGRQVPQHEPEMVPLASYGRGLGHGEYLSEEDAPRHGSGLRALHWLGWVAAALLAFAAGSLYQQRDAMRSIIATQSSTMNEAMPGVAQARQVMEALTDPTAKRIVLNATPPAKPTPQGRATYVAGRGTLIFVADNLLPLPPAKVYELWLIPPDGAAPVAAGTFRPNAKGSATVIMPTLPKGIEAKAFEVTIEAAGGATKPTLPILLTGE